MKFSSLHSIITTILILSFFIPVIIAEENISKQGPDYEISDAVLSMAESMSSPGATIHPVITIKNNGSNSSDTQAINISARFGNGTILSPISAEIPILKAGERKVITLVYSIPQNTEYGGYDLFFEVDPDNKINDINRINNKKKATGTVSILPPDDEEFLGCEACWEGYR